MARDEEFDFLTMEYVFSGLAPLSAWATADISNLIEVLEAELYARAQEAQNEALST